MDPFKQTTPTSTWSAAGGSGASPKPAEPAAASASAASSAEASVNGSVFLLEPNVELRRDLENAILGIGLRTRVFDSLDSFWGLMESLSQPSYLCAVLEMRYPEASGLDVQRRLLAGPHSVSIVFFAAQARLREVVRAMRAGAIGVTEKSEGVSSLLGYIEEGLEKARVEFQLQRQCAHTVNAIHSLSAGERSVMQGILSGKLNKEIAQELALSIRTIEQRRREVFRKIGVQHPASLARKVMQVAHNPRMSTADKEYFRALAECLSDWGDEPPRSLRLDSPHD